MRAMFIAIFIFGASALASAKPYMKCTHITPAREKVLITVDLIKSKADRNDERIQNLEMKIKAVHANGEKKTYTDSSGWLRDDGQFNFNFCSKGKCSANLSGQITSAGKVKNVDLSLPTDALSSTRALNSCGLL